MKRTQIYLLEEQARKLGERASATGTTKSSIVRRAIADYLVRTGDDGVRLSRFRGAVIEAADARLDLPRGAEYVERLRSATCEHTVGPSS